MQLFNRFRKKVRRRLAGAFRRIAASFRRRRHHFFEPLEARHMMASDWQNPLLPADVNASNGEVTALDALIVINELNNPRISSAGGVLPALSQNVTPPPYLDPTGDGHITATDALLVINYLSTQSGASNTFQAPAASALPATSSVSASALAATGFFNQSSELLLNTPSPYLQQTPAIAVTAGGSVVVWSSVVQDGSDWGVYGQRLDQQGQKVGPEFRVNQTTFKSQWSPSIDALPDGRFVVTWEGLDQTGDPGWGIYARVFNADATPAGDEFRVNETTSGTQRVPTVAALSDGTFAITWEGKGIVNKKLKEDYEVFVRRFSSTGTPLSAQTRVNANTKGAQEHPVIAAVPAGGFAITWNGYGVSDSAGVYLRRFSASGAPVGSEILVNSTFKKGDQRQASLDFAADGRILVTWASTDHQNGWGVYAQRFNANGSRLGNEILVNQYLSGTQWHPSIASLPDSTFIVAWEGKSAADPYGISYRQFSAAGVAITGEQLLNQTTLGTQRDAVLGVGQTSFMVAWDGFGSGDYDGIYSRGAATSGPPINQPPVTTIPAAQSLNEDSVFAFSAASNNRITIADSDAGSDPIEVTLAVSHGKLTLTNRTGLTFSFNDGQDDAAFKFTGTVADVNAALNTLFYAPTPDYNGPDGLNIMTSDLGHNGVGSVGTDNDTISLNILAVNDAPSFTKGGDQNADSSAGAQSVANWATAISAGPTDEAGQTLTFQITATNTSLFSVQPAISPAGTLTFTPAANTSGSTSVTVRLKDSGGTLRNGVDTSAAQTFTINLANGGQIDSSPFTLREGSAFNTDVNRSFVVPATASTLQIFFDAPSFDTQSQGTVRDAFEAALVDANGQTLVHTIANSRDAFFNQTEGLSSVTGVNTQLSSGLIQLDLSHIPAGTQATLVVRLVNDDTDTNSSVRITNLKIIAGSLNTPVGTVSAAALPVATVSAADFPRLTNISSDITPTFGATSLHEDNTVLFTDVALKNTGNTTLRGPLVAVVDSLSDPSVAVQNPDGFTPTGLPYFNFQASVPGGTLIPGESTTSRTLSFLNPSGLQFTFHVSVYTFANTEPTVTDIPTQEALVGQPFIYQVDASDAEGDGLSFALLAGPPSMTISPTGQLNWIPTANDTGTQQVKVRITDSAGGTVDETFTIVVRNNVSNRPPMITSSPVTDAAVAVSFDITDYTVGRGPVGLAIGNFTGNGQSIVTANEVNQSISLADYIAAGSSSNARTTILGEPPPRTDQLFEQGYNVDVGMVFNRTQDITGVTTADFNGDGIADLATTIHANGGFQEDNALTVMLGLGDGTYDVPLVLYRSLTPQDTNRVVSVLARDFDGDGKSDLLAGESGAKNLMFFKGHGDGTFDTAVKSLTIYRPQYIRTADLNNDQKLDLFVIGENGEWQPEVLLGNGDGTFGASTQYINNNVRYISDGELGDFDGINGPDLAIADWSANRLEVRLNDGTGHFGAPLFQDLTTAEGCCTSGHAPPAAMTIADFDGDGKVDIHMGGYGDYLFFKGDGDGTFTLPTTSSPLVSYLGLVPSRAYADGGNTPVDLNGDGKLDVYYASRFNNILVVGFGRGNGIFDFDLMYSQPAPDDPTRRPEGTGFSAAIVIDANNDGVLDIATAGYSQAGDRPGRLGIILGDTPGSFRTPYVYRQGLTANLFTDLNNDGAPDILAVSGPLASSLNNADGTFADYQRALGGLGNEFYLNYAVSTDFDGDGNQDAFWVGTAGVQNGLPTRLLISRGLGNGLFESPTVFGVGTGAFQIGAADLTGDNKPEAISVTTGGIGKVIQIWKNNGTGTGFTIVPDANARLQYPNTSSLSGFVAADFDGDGVSDLVASSRAGDNNSPPEQFLFFKGYQVANPTDVSELFGAPLITTPGLGEIRRMIAADLNNDGDLDLVMKGAFNTYTMLGNSNGTFGPLQTLNFGVEDVTVGDFNGDGIPDIGTSNSFYAPGFVLGNGDGTFGRVQYYAPSSAANYMVDAADVDGDGIDDFLLSSGNDAGSYRASSVFLSRRPGIQSAATGDINGDGKLDALAVDYGLGHLTPLLGDGQGNVTRQHDIIVGRGPVAATMLDLNNDTKDDIISVNRAANTISVLVNNGSGNFTRTDLATGRRPAAIATANFTSDQVPDLVVANSDETSVSIFKSTGSGQYAAGVRLPIGIHPTQVALSDVNGDGRADIIATSETGRAYVIALNDGNGGFAVQTAIPIAASTSGLAVGDLNGDGRADLVVTNPDERQVSLYLGLGAGKFATPQPIRFDHAPTAVKLADMNGDGRLDIVTSNSDSDTATVIISRFNPASTYRYQVTAADPDGDTVSFALQTAPSGMSIDGTNGQITWSATPDQIGPHNVVIQAADGHGGFATQRYTVTVASGDNTPPRFVTTPISTTLSTTDYHYSARAADSDKGPVRYEIASGPDGMTIDANTGDLSWGKSIGRGLTFNGIDDMVVVGSTPSLNFTNEFTYSTWVKFDKTPVETGHDAFLVSSTNQTDLVLSARNFGGFARFEFNTFGRRASSSTIIQDGQWYHVTATYKFDQTIRLYVNGVSEAEVTVAGLQHPGETFLTFGNNPVGGTRELGLAGELDSVRVFNTTLSPEQAANEFHRAGPDAPGLVGDYQFNELEGPLAYDLSGNKNDGTLTAPYAGRRMRATFADRVTPAGRSGDYPIVVRATDGRGGTSEQPFTLHITADAPASLSGTVFNDQNADGQATGDPALANWTVYLDLDHNGTRESFEPSATTDSQGHYSFTNLTPATYTVSIAGQTGFRPTSPALGSASVTLSAGQSKTDANFGETSLSVAAGPRGPIFTSLAPATGQVNSLYTYQTQVKNLDGRPLTFDVLVAPDGFAMNAQTGGIAWVPTTDQSGPNRVLIRVKDDRGLVDIQDFTINVAAAPTAPVFTSLPLTSAALNVSYKYQARVQDAEGGPFVFALTNSPAGMTINAQTGLVSWTPTSGQQNISHQVTITATDSTGLTAQQDFTIAVAATATNHAPDITSSPRKTAGLARPYRYQLTATDADADAIAFSLVNPPTGMTIDSNNIIRWSPDQLGDYLVTILATDGRSGSDSQSFTASVTSQLKNSLPQFTTVPPAAVAAGTPFAYNAHATDADGDAVQYILDKGPAGLSLDPDTGTLRWQTTASLRGDFEITIRALDPYGAEATQSFTLAVRSASAPPAITSIPPTTASANFSYSYAVAAADPFGRPLTYSLLTFPTGMTINASTGVITWTPTNAQLGPQSVEVQVANTEGGAASQTFSIVVNDGTPNLPPVITSTAPENATASAAYQYDITATDPEGQLAGYSLKSGPAGVSINQQTGRLTWTPTAAQIGSHQITVAATDLAGATALQTFLVTVLPVNHAPTINSIAPTKPISGGATFRYTVAATDQDSDVLTYTLTQAPAGMTINPFGRLTWLTPPRTTQQGPLNAPVTVNVSDGRGGSVNQQFTLNIVPDTTAPKVSVVPATNLVYFPNSLTVRVAASDDVAIASLSLKMGNQQIPLDANGIAVIPFPGTASSIQTLTATATDTSGNTVTGSNSVKFFNGAEEPNYPDVSIASPADSGVVFGPTDVIGTVAGAGITEWHLLCRREDADVTQDGEDTFVEINSGTGPVNNGLLGRFDPTLLENDAYILRLIAKNASGFETFDDHRIGVSGDLKLGNFRLSFVDISIPITGIPISLARTYDTLRATRQGDFGFGWRLEFRDTDLRTGLPKTGLEDFGIYSAFRPGTKVYLTLPGGIREGFTFTPDIRTVAGFGGTLTTVTPRFTSDRGVRDTLSVARGTFILGDDGAVYSGGGQPYNPAAEEFGGGYALTTRDGTVYRIDGNSGKLTAATDRDGNQLTFSDSGISGSGANLSFQRNAQGRIVRVTDPSGKSLNYAYSAAGDLTTVTNRNGHATQFIYRTNPEHYLDSVKDPLGRTGTRAVYGPDGRLTSTQDGNGQSSSASYDPNNSRVTTRDALSNATTTEYDQLGNIVAVTDALGSVTRYTYNADNNITSVTDPLGFTRHYDYAAGGNLIRFVDPLGGMSHLNYRAGGQLTAVVGPAGQTASNTLNVQGQVLSLTLPTGATTTVQRDANGRLTGVTDAVGNSVQFTTAGGFRTSLTDVTGQTATYTRNANGQLTAESRPYRSAAGTTPTNWSYQYDANGSLLRAVGPDGAAIVQTVDAAGQTTSTTTPDGVTTHYTYSPNGDLLTAVTDGGQTDSFTYDALGRQTSSTRTGGRRTDTTYDAVGRVSSHTVSGLGTTTYQYDAEGNQTAITDPAGRISRYQYDALRRVTKFTDPAGRVTTYTYDQAGNLATLTDPSGGVTQSEYDANGKLIRTLRPDGSVVSATDNAIGRPTMVQDALNGAYHFEYDVTGQVSAVVDAAGQRTTYAHDSNGNFEGITDPLGRTTLLSYDSLARLTSFTTPAGRTVQYTYSTTGLLTSMTNADGHITRYEYDIAGHLLRRTFDGVTIDTQQYDANGLLTSFSAGTQSATITRATSGLPTVITSTNGVAVSVAYTAGEVTQVGTSAGNTTFARDAAGQLSTISGPGGDVVNLTHDALGRLTRTDLPGGGTILRDYDSGHRLTRLRYQNAANSVVYEADYTFDAADRVVMRQETPGSLTTFAYDALGRLISESTGASTTLYSYDAAGNRLSRQQTEANQTISYDSDDRVQSDGTATYAFDVRGNMISRSVPGGASEQFNYDAAGHMIRYVRTGANPTTITYEYDFDGLLAARTQDGLRVRFVWDRSSGPLPQLLETRDAAGAVIARYLVDGQYLASVHTAAGSSHLLTDPVGTVLRVVNPNGTVQATHGDAFGVGNGLVAGIGFGNGWTDTETGFVFSRARWYDPRLGRFTQVDAAPPDANRPASLNRYVYCSADPVNRSDPTGLFEFRLDAQIVKTFITGLLAKITFPFAVKTIVIGGLIGGAKYGDLFNPSRFSAAQVALSASVTASYGPGGISGASGFELLAFFGPRADYNDLALYGYYGGALSIGNGSGASLTAGLSVGVGAVFDAKVPSDYAGNSYSFSGSVGLQDFKRVEDTLSLSTQLDINYRHILTGGKSLVVFPALAKHANEVTFGSTSAAVSFSISAGKTYDEDGVDRYAHAITFIPVGLSLGINAGKSSSLSIGISSYDLLVTGSGVFSSIKTILGQ